VRKLVLLLVAAGFGYWLWPGPEPATVAPGASELPPLVEIPGLSVAGAPVQQAVASTGQALVLGDYRVTPLAEFHAEARVLGAEQYRLGREAELSPVDLALGWGPMAEDEVLAAIEIRQSGRWYRWRTDAFPIPRRDIERHSANMHIIPANAAVDDALRSVRAGHTVTLRGYLVEVEGADGWRWRSSLSRDDTGQGGCELVLVEALRYR
jgi:hypothetical protein